MRVMILAAGLGTRLKPLTDSLPKALIKIKEHTLLELQIKKLKAAGFDKIIINLHHHADMIEDYLRKNNNFRCDITLSDEREKLLDTGGGLKKAAWFFDEGKPFLVHNVDVLTDLNLKELLDFHHKEDATVTLAVMERVSSRYFLFDEENVLVGWKNEKTGETKVVHEVKGKMRKLAFSGIQIIDPKIFRYFPDEDVFSLVDLYLAAASKEKIVAYNHSDRKWLDVGKKENLKTAEILFEELKSTYQA